MQKTKIPICINQVEFHPFFNQKKLFEFCKNNNIVMIAYSPLARGLVFEDETLKRIGDSHGKNAGQVALRLAIQKGIVVIPKASSEEHLQRNLNIFDFELSIGEMHKIKGLNRDQRIVDPVDISEFDRHE